MYLTGLTHRDGLFEVAQRWLLDRPGAGDGLYVTRVFLLENLISAPTVRGFVDDILHSAWPGEHESRHLHSKDQVRRAIMAACQSPSRREATLFAKFEAHPEDFFPRTPVDITLASQPDGKLLAMTRQKRIRRIADKVSRRVADRLAGEIRTAARVLARERADEAGVTLKNLISSPELMDAEFAEAERTVAQSFRDGSLRFEAGGLRVDDVIGTKFIGIEEELDRVEAAIRAHPAVTVHSRELHRGDYNDVNLLLDLELPPVGTIVDRLRGRDWGAATRRGLDPDVLERDLAEYVEAGARSVRTEVILTTFDELVESEFGRSMHEERILAQRFDAPYCGRIAQNAAYIIEYLLNVAVSPSVEVHDLPIKMWGRYLPDTLSVAISRLASEEAPDRLFDAFAQPPTGVCGGPTAGQPRR